MNDNLTYTPVVVGDSEGKRLKCSTGRRSKLYCKGSSTSVDIITWINRNLNKVIEQFGPIRIYFWIDTCDLTIFKDSYISLKVEKSVKP